MELLSTTEFYGLIMNAPYDNLFDVVIFYV